MFSRAATSTRAPCFVHPRHNARILRVGFATAHARRSFPKRAPDKIDYNPFPAFGDSSQADTVAVAYRRVTANELESHAAPPTRVKMLVRDFIEDSLYNPNYGYFSKQATIFSAIDKPIEFGRMRDGAEFQEEVASRYTEYGMDNQDGPGRQIWHTPTELFQPYYGHAVARCIVSEYLLKYFPYEDLIIYEMGAGNGTLAMNILDYLRDEHPEVYERTRYNIIEISAALASNQKKRLEKAHPCVTVNHKSALHWDTKEPAPCYFIAMEVVDNFAHDTVRYDMKTLEPYQTMVAVDENGDFSTHYTRVTDPLISQYLSIRRQLSHPIPIPALLRSSPTARNVYSSLPFAPNLSVPEWIPTRLLSLLTVLRRNFPRHRLLLSDFSSLPDAIRPGVNAPVVQTRYQNTTVPCSTFLVRQGFFDIFFPTDFERLRDMYEHVLAQPDPSAALRGLGDEETLRSSPTSATTSPLSLGAEFFSAHMPGSRRSPADGILSSSGLPVGERKSGVYTHQQFLDTYADLDATKLRNGENPMVEFYENVKFLF